MAADLLEAGPDQFRRVDAEQHGRSQAVRRVLRPPPVVERDDFSKRVVGWRSYLHFIHHDQHVAALEEDQVHLDELLEARLGVPVDEAVVEREGVAEAVQEVVDKAAPHSAERVVLALDQLHDLLHWSGCEELAVRGEHARALVDEALEGVHQLALRRNFIFVLAGVPAALAAGGGSHADLPEGFHHLLSTHDAIDQ